MRLAIWCLIDAAIRNLPVTTEGAYTLFFTILLGIAGVMCFLLDLMEMSRGGYTQP